MKIKDIIEYINQYAEIFPEILDYEVKAVAFNEDGARDYDILIKDVTIADSEKTVRLWDF